MDGYIISSAISSSTALDDSGGPPRPSRRLRTSNVSERLGNKWAVDSSEFLDVVANLQSYAQGLWVSVPPDP